MIAKGGEAGRDCGPHPQRASRASPLACSSEHPPKHGREQGATSSNMEQGSHDVKAQQEILRYPRTVFLVIVNEFCERFAFYCLRTILVIYLKEQLSMTEDASTLVFHTFNMACYLFPIMGGIISDSWLGKYRTILYLSLLYAAGSTVVALASWRDLGLPAFALTCVGLLLIAVGTGGIKPCVASFGGDQFVLPQQSRQLAGFFSLFYFIINLGGMLSIIASPELRALPCLGQDSCYPLAFGTPALLMLFFCGVFVSGRRHYVIKAPEGNMLVLICKCISNAVWNRLRGRGRDTAQSMASTPTPSKTGDADDGCKPHWLDAADPARFDAKLVADIKVLLRLVVLAVPLPVFWALFDMQGSRWTFQAEQLDGRLGGWTLKPDQIQLAGALFVVIMLPTFEAWLHPALRRCGLLATPLQRMSVGGLMAAAAYVAAGLLQLQIQGSDAQSVHILWQLPQYFFIALADIWFAIAVLEFGYREAPPSLKSSVNALFLLTTSIGDIIVIIVTGSDLFQNRVTEFFVYAGLMTAVMCVFIYLASKYTYVDDGRHRDADPENVRLELEPSPARRDTPE